MRDTVMFAVFPYVALALAVVGGIYRYATDRFTYSSLSSQFVENRTLFWGSVPWHYGIIPILLAHLFSGLFPGVMGSVLGDLRRLLILELTGLCLGFAAVFGILILIIRRISSPHVLTTTTVMDWVLLVFLTAQAASGVSIALVYRWGSLWYLSTAVPWFWSLFCLDPNFSALTALPALIRFHMFNGFVIFALFPFTRLVHVFTVPVTYLWRPYQVVIWNRRRRGVRGPEQ